MNNSFLPSQQEVTPTAQPDLYIKISGLYHKLLIEFLITQRIPFGIIPCVEESEPTSTERVEEMSVAPNKVPDDIKKVLERVYVKYILKNIDTPPNVEQIAAEIDWSASKFKSRFKTYYGKPFYQVYMEHKMKFAAKLLKEGHKAMNVSEKVGYSQPIKFSKTFQKYYGMTPHKYKKQFEM